MNLYTLLKDRAGINILKILYDNETEGSFTLQQSVLLKRLRVQQSPSTIGNLQAAALISVERSGDTRVFAITKKGKKFLEQFDRLIAAYEGQTQKEKAYKVSYDLTELEQRILVIASKMQGELGAGIYIDDLTQEVYPFDDVKRKKSIVSRYINRLVELNLVEKKDDSVSLTSTGVKAIKEQFMEVKV